MNQAGKDTPIHTDIIWSLVLQCTDIYNVGFSPVVLSVTDSVLEGNFVLATLADDSHQRKDNTRR